MSNFGSFVAGIANVKGRVFDLYVRDTAAWTDPAITSEYDTALALFEKIGTIGTSLELHSEDGNIVDTVDGDVMLNHKVIMNSMLYEIPKTNIDDLIAAHRAPIDILLQEQDGDVGDMYVVIKNVPFNWRFKLTGGGEQGVPINIKKTEETPEDVILFREIPAAA